MGKKYKASSSTKWRLGQNIDLRLIECLTPSFSFDIFMDNYFTSLRLLTHLGVNNSRATCVLNKNSLRKFTIIGDKRGVATWNREHQAKKQCNFTVVG